MQVQKVAVTRADGGISIMGFIVEGRGNVLPDGAVWFSNGVWAREPNDYNIGNEVVKTVPDHVSWRRVEDSEIPTDRTFRDALVDTGSLEHDVEKARELKREQLRHERATAFIELDGQWMRAFARGDARTAAEVEAKRQALRDLPASDRIREARTVDELKVIELPA